MKFFKRILALLLVSCLLFCVAPATFAQESDTTINESTEEDIRDNPIAQGALKDIIDSFVNAFLETVTRYVQAIIELIMEAQQPETPDTDTSTEVPVVA